LKRQIAACTVNPRYREGLFLNAELERVLNKRQHLRIHLTKTKIVFEKMRAVTLLLDQASATERLRLRTNASGNIDRLRWEERLETRPAKHRTQIEGLLGQIDELNGRLADIGLADQAVDVGALRERMLPPQERTQKRKSMSGDKVPRPPAEPPQRTARRKSTPPMLNQTENQEQSKHRSGVDDVEESATEKGGEEDSEDQGEHESEQGKGDDALGDYEE
jgi:hypothetical protein